MQKTSARLLSLLSLLQTHRERSGAELAERLDTTTRTVRRDIGRLRDLGYPITTVKGPAGGYRLEAGARMPPMLFDDGQAVALAVALQTAADGTAVPDDAARALAALRQVMPSRLRHRIDLLRVTAVRPHETPDGTRVDNDVLVELSRAIHAREELRFDYAPSPTTANGGRRRRVEPHHLATWRRHWYLVAWDLDRGDWRTFRADRIRPRTPTGPRFAPRDLPGRSVSEFLTGRFRGNDDATADWPCRGEVVLHLPAAQAAPFTGDGIVEDLDGHRCRLTLGSWSWTGLAAALGRFDADFDVVGPPPLAAACADLAARYARAAEPDTDPIRPRKAERGPGIGAGEDRHASSP